MRVALTQYVNIPSGTTASSAFTTLGTYKTGLVVETMSLGTATAVFVEFASVIDANQWARLQRADGSGVPWTVGSGTGRLIGVIATPPGMTAGRIALGAAQSAVCSFAVLSVRRT